MSDRDWLYYGVPVTLLGSAYGQRFRFWRFVEKNKAWCIEYGLARKQARPLLVDADKLRISQRPSDPPAMPAWAWRDEKVSA